MQQATIQPSKPTYVPTVGMSILIANAGVCRSIAVNAPHIKEVLAQIQLDSVTESNMAEIGPMLLALRKIQEVFTLFEQRGQIFIEHEKHNASKQ